MDDDFSKDVSLTGDAQPWHFDYSDLESDDSLVILKDICQVFNISPEILHDLGPLDSDNLHSNCSNPANGISPIVKGDYLETSKRTDPIDIVGASDEESDIAGLLREFPGTRDEIRPHEYHFTAYCDDCETEYSEGCPTHGRREFIKDTPVNFWEDHCSDVAEYAKRTTPSCLRVAPSAIKNAGLGVWTTETIPARSCFGPFVGTVILEPTSTSWGWQVQATRGSYKTWYIDASDPNTSNWMRYVNCSRNFSEQNLVAYQYNGEVYYGALREIPPNSEVFIFCDDGWAEELGIDMKRYFRKPRRRLPVESFSCEICEQKFDNPIERDEHEERHRVAEESERGSNPRLRSAGASSRVREPVGTPRTSKKEKRSGITIRSCPLCRKMYREEPRLWRNVYRQGRDKVGECKICGAMFSRPSHLCRHMAVHSKVLRYDCNACHSRFKIRDHMVSHLRRCSYALRCDVCQMIFTNEKDYRDHVRADKCTKPPAKSTKSASRKRRRKNKAAAHGLRNSSCSRKEHLYNNQARVRDKSEKIHACARCGKKFHSGKSLEQHTTTHSKL